VRERLSVSHARKRVWVAAAALAMLVAAGTAVLPGQQPEQARTATPPAHTYRVRGIAVTHQDMRRFDALLQPKTPRAVRFREVPGPLLMSGPGQAPGAPAPQDVAGSGSAPGSLLPGPAPASISPTPPLISSFPGMLDIVLDNNRVIPPDTQGAAGPTHLVSLTNRGYAVLDRTTGAFDVGPISLQAFWAALGTGAGQPAADPFDPKVLYDQYSGRFVVASDSGGDGAPSWVLVGISMGSDPTLGWTLFAIDADATSPGQFADFTGLGLDPTSVYISDNMFNNPPAATFAGAKFWVVDKASLMAGGPITVSEFFSSAVGGNWRPAHTFGATAVNYAVNEGWTDHANSTHRWVRVERFSYPGPLITDLGFIQVADYGFDPLGKAPQPGCAQLIDTGDTRLLNALLRGGQIWTTGHVDDPVHDGVGKSEVAWYQIDPVLVNASGSNAVGQQGRVGDPVRWYYYPSIAVNDSGCVALGFSGSDSGTFGSAFYTARRPTDTAGTMAPVGMLKGGVDSYYVTFSGTLNRWGDYSATEVDPTDGRTFWTVQEFAGQQSGGACPMKDTGRWGTWWGSFRCGCVANADCDDGVFCNGAETCDSTSGACLASTPPTCNDGNSCTADSCDASANACVHTPIPVPGQVGDTIQETQDPATGAATITWSAIVSATIYNTYRGTIPVNLLRSRGVSPYDHVCFESADSAGNGATLSRDAGPPAAGAAFYYLVDGENTCAEGALGNAPDGSVTPNSSPCPTPP